MRTTILGVALLLAAAAASAQNQAASDAEYGHGLQAMSAGKYAEAAKAFEKAEKAAGHCGKCALGAANAYARLGDLGKADQAADRAIFDAETAKNISAIAHNLKSIIALRRAENDPKQYEIAERQARMAMADDPTRAAYQFNAAVLLIKMGRDQEGVAELQKVLQRPDAGAFAADAQRFIAKPILAKYDAAPPLDVTLLSGEHFSLQQFAGKVVVVDFWATWCHPCVESVPDLKDLTKKYPSDRFVLVSISADDDEKAWKAFVAKKQMAWAQTRDSNRAIRERFNVNAFPTYLVIDGDGLIRQRLVGEDPQQSVASRLKKVLAQMPELQASK